MQATVEPEHTTQLHPVEPPAPEVCGRCHFDDLDDDGYCLACGAVTLTDHRYVVSYDPDA